MILLTIKKYKWVYLQGTLFLLLNQTMNINEMTRNNCLWPFSLPHKSASLQTCSSQGRHI